jgi:Uma2 family endonuclease
MLAAPTLTTKMLLAELDTQDQVRIPATEQDYFDLMAEENDAVYLEFNTDHLIARPNVNTENHELVTANVIGLLYVQFLQKPGYRVFGSNRPVYVMGCQKGFAADVLAVKGPTELYPCERDMAATLNPWLLVEVISDSNRGPEFQRKLHCYKQIPALQHILLIEPDAMLVSAYSRTERPNQWLNIDYVSPDEAVAIGDFSLPLADLYRHIALGQ